MAISIVMATYNGEKYIVEQLESIVSQISLGDEIIICDDCSSDNTVKIVEAYINNKHLQDIISISVNEHN